MGLGDSLYLQSIARHMVEQGQYPEVCTKYPDIFRPITSKIRISPFRRDRIDRVCHYISRKKFPETDQFTDCCINGGFDTDIELRLDWKGRHAALAKSHRQVVVVQMPRAPMARFDGFGNDLMPSYKRMQEAINLVRRRAITVMIGKGKPLHRFTGIDLDLTNKTTVGGMLDAAATADGFLGYCSFIAPLAESLRKPLFLVWSRKGLGSHNEFIRRITPQKIFHRAESMSVMDDCSGEEMRSAIDTFLEQVGSRDVVQRQENSDSRQWAGVPG